MKGILAMIAAVACLAAASSAADMTVMSYYIRNCNGMDGRCDVRRVAEVVKSQGPDTCGRPVLVAGDFNDTPDSEFIRRVRQDYTALTDLSQCTYPADKPAETLDYIFTPADKSHMMTIMWTKTVADSVASDHRPVAVRLRLP